MRIRLEHIIIAVSVRFLAMGSALRFGAPWHQSLWVEVVGVVLVIAGVGAALLPLFGLAVVTTIEKIRGSKRHS